MTTHSMFVSAPKVGPLNLAALTAVLMFVGNATFASDAAGPATATDPTAQSGLDQGQPAPTLQPVVVTATRRSESINRVPMTVQALTAQSLTNLNVQTFADLVTHTPGVTLRPTTSGNQTNVAIRGIYSGGNAPTTEVYINDTPISVRTMNGAGPSGSPYPDVFDLDRVEVLSGPQGTLFGSSAMGGVIRYITPQPNLYSSSGFASMDAGYTSNGEPSSDVGVAYGTPIVPGVAGFRVSVWGSFAGGWIDRVNPYNGAKTCPDCNSSSSFVANPAFSVVPVDGLKITVAMFIQHIKENSPDDYWVTLVPTGDPISSGALPEPSNDDLRVPSLTITYHFDDMNFESDTSYVDREYHDIIDFTQDIENDYTPTVLIPGLENFYSPFLDQEFTHAWQQEFRLSSANPSSRVSWIAGAYLRKALTFDTQLIPPDLSPITEYLAGETSLQYTGFPDYYVHGIALNSYTRFFTRDESEAIYGSTTVRIIDGLSVSAGVRIEHSVVDDQSQIIAGPLNGLTYSNVLLPDQSGNPVTPRVSLTEQINSNDMVYATVAKGYRAGGGNSLDSVGNPLCGPSLKQLGLTTAPSAFSSDSLWSYELGTKDTALQGRLSAQLAVYDIVWSNIQAPVALPSCSEGFTANRGKAYSRGVTLTVQALVGDHLQLNFSGGYDNAYYPNAEYGAAKNGVTPVIVAAGEKLADVMPWSADIYADYSRNIGSLWSGAQGYLRIDYAREGGYPSLDPIVAGYDPRVGPFQNQGYGLLAVNLGVTKNGLNVSLFVHNATNADPLLDYAHNSPSSPLFTAVALRPRTVGVSLKYEF